jgi:hypothetical protein
MIRVTTADSKYSRQVLLTGPFAGVGSLPASLLFFATKTSSADLINPDYLKFKTAI